MIVDKLSNKQEFFISVQSATPLGVFGQPHANSPIDKSLDMCCRCCKLIGLENLKIQVTDLAKVTMERIKDPE
jgi:hypothetical protein